MQHGTTYFGTSLIYLSYASVFFPKLICFCLLLRTTSSVSLSDGLAESFETELKNKSQNETVLELLRCFSSHINIQSATAMTDGGQNSYFASLHRAESWTNQTSHQNKLTGVFWVNAIAQVCNKQTYSRLLSARAALQQGNQVVHDYCIHE